MPLIPLVVRKWAFKDGRVVYATAGEYFLNYYPPTTPVKLDNLPDTIRLRHYENVTGVRTLYGLPTDSLRATTFTNASWVTHQVLPLAPAESVSVTYGGIAQGFSNRDTSYVAVDTVRSRYGGVTVCRLTIYVQGTTAVGRNGSAPTEFSLAQNYPNPFNPVTTISYVVGHRSPVSLKVFDVLGREVATLVHEVKEAGDHSIQFDAHGVASGVYLYRLTAGTFVETKKFVIIR